MYQISWKSISICLYYGAKKLNQSGASWPTYDASKSNVLKNVQKKVNTGPYTKFYGNRSIFVKFAKKGDQSGASWPTYADLVSAIIELIWDNVKTNSCAPLWWICLSYCAETKSNACASWPTYADIVLPLIKLVQDIGKTNPYSKFRWNTSRFVWVIVRKPNPKIEYCWASWPT